jgi:hypothetical protein
MFSDVRPVADALPDVASSCPSGPRTAGRLLAEAAGALLAEALPELALDLLPTVTAAEL